MVQTSRVHWVVLAGIAVGLLSLTWTATARAEFTTIEWLDLIPAEELDALQNPPAYIASIKEGSAEDQVGGELRNSSATGADDPYQQALISTNVNEDLNGQGIRIPGFVVPLEFNDDLFVTQFLLVPYFGACIHVPAPPPNQIILVNAPDGFRLEALYKPFWVSGVVKTSVTENDLATTAYTLDLASFEAYE
ncbi:MAG: DUF3299 domain-containing protein [Pseudomonadota bacterium]